MSVITCTRRLQFCSGHRVMGHENKCRNMHGHNYVIYITAEAKDLDSLGRVIDFSVLKDKFGTWIDTYFDHGFIVYEKDEEVLAALAEVPDTKVYLMPTNPTAENMAKYLLDKSEEILDSKDVKVTMIKLYETENCFAVATV